MDLWSSYRPISCGSLYDYPHCYSNSYTSRAYSFTRFPAGLITFADIYSPTYTREFSYSNGDTHRNTNSYAHANPDCHPNSYTCADGRANHHGYMVKGCPQRAGFRR